MHIKAIPTKTTINADFHFAVSGVFQFIPQHARENFIRELFLRNTVFRHYIYSLKGVRSDRRLLKERDISCQK